MPRTTLPPTPAASGDIPGKEGTSNSQASDKTFNLPPPAISQTRTSAPASNPKPIQPAASPNFSLPPPPTRSRTIIQMKPKTPQNDAPAERRPTSKGSAGSAKKTTAHGGAGGRKQPSSTSVAGKKIARKTAHSVIERRRRSKMNEEFGVLKAMIPACVDQEMHKLAILQASIDYLRYLETCITDLKAANKSLSTPLLHPQPPPPRNNTSIPRSGDDGEDDLDPDSAADSDQDSDTAMADVAAAPSSASLTPALSAHPATASTSAYTSPQSIQNSPALDPPRASHRGSYSSLSTLPSPAFGPQKNYNNNTNNAGGNANADFPTRPQSHHSHSAPYPSLSLSASTSPTLLPSNREQDQEATAALLMLNQDRRSTGGGGARGGRGMSVKDLLSC